MEILAPDSIALTPMYNLLKAPICLVSECSAPLRVAKNAIGFSSVAIWQIDLDSITDASLAERKMKIIM